MQTVYLKGEFGERFGEKWSTNVSTVQDIFKLIECQRDGYRQYMLDCAENGIDFTVQKGEEFIDETEFLLSAGKDDIIVTPIPAGSNRKVGNLIAAAFMIYRGYFLVSGATSAATGVTTASQALIHEGGKSFAKTMLQKGIALGTKGKIAGYTLMALGTSLGLRTLAEIFVPDPSEPEDDSHLFSGPMNTTVQGGAVPILYGEMQVGGHLINASYHSHMAHEWGPGYNRNSPLGIDDGHVDLEIA